MQYSHVIRECSVKNGTCRTHGFAASKISSCPQSTISDDEWQAAWDEIDQFVADLKETLEREAAAGR
jgi:hypothetical protein